MNGYAEWDLLKLDWSYYITATFPLKTSRDRATKVWNYFTNKLARMTLSSREARGRGLPWIRSIETHSSGGVHIHALIKTQLAAPKVVALWRRCAGSGICDVRVYNPARDALGYVTKSGDVELARYFNRNELPTA